MATVSPGRTAAGRTSGSGMGRTSRIKIVSSRVQLRAVACDAEADQVATVLSGFQRPNGGPQEVGVGVHVAAPVLGVPTVGVRTPLPHVSHHVEHTERRRSLGVAVDATKPASARWAMRRHRQVATPRVPPAVRTPGGKLPLRLAGQPPTHPGGVPLGPRPRHHRRQLARAGSWAHVSHRTDGVLVAGGSDGVRHVGRWQGAQVRGEAVTADQPLVHPVRRDLHGRLIAFTDRFEAENGAHYVNVLVSQTEPGYAAGYPYLGRSVSCAGSASDRLEVVDVDLLGEVAV